MGSGLMIRYSYILVDIYMGCHIDIVLKKGMGTGLMIRFICCIHLHGASH